jgi:hypothetical protein
VEHDKANLGHQAERPTVQHLASKVVIVERRGKGHIRISFADLYDFERLFTTLTGQKLEIAYPPSRSE